MNDTVVGLISVVSFLLVALGGMIWKLGSQIGGLTASLSDLKDDVNELKVATNTATSAAIETATAAAKASSIALGAIGATVTLESDGTNWQITAGQQDTGWISFTPTSPYTVSSNTYYRKMGNIVKLKGSVQAGSSVNSSFWTPPAGFAPGGVPGFQVTDAGNTASAYYAPPWNIYNPSSGIAYFVDAIQYTVD